MTKPRSYDQLKRFFSVIGAAFHQWPEHHPFQPQDAEHLRAWLLVRAKHCTVKTFYLTGDAEEYARVIPIIIGTMLHKHSWAKSDGNALHVCVPESINYQTLGHNAFCVLNDEVDAIIREAGLDPDALLRERAA